MYQNLAELLAQSGQTVDPSQFQMRHPVQHNDPSQVLQPVQPLQPNQPQSFIDVHAFDYSYADHDHEDVELTNQEKHDWITQLTTIMQHPIARQGAHLISANIGNIANMDRTNDKSAEDILVLLAQHMIQKDRSLLPMLEEQLIDMVQLGQCAQGRTTRLWQLYVTLPK